MGYSDNDRNEILAQSKSEINRMQTVNLGFAYNMYDIMRLQLEELHHIRNAMESMLEIIQKEQ